MKNKMKSIFKLIFSNKKTKMMFCLSAISFVLLITVTFAWFVSIIELPNSKIETGTLDIVAKGYDVNGDFISTIITDKEYNPEDPDMININAPLFEIKNWSSNSITTCYISIENSGTLELDYALTFKVGGSAEHLQNMGGFWYRIERLNNLELDYSLGTYLDGTKLETAYKAKSAYYDNVIKDYISKAEPTIVCGDNCIQEDGTYSHVCTEYDALSRNLVTLSHLAEYGTLDLNLDGDKRTIYRLDIGFRKEAIEERYTSVSLDINGEVYATQKGAILNPDGVGSVITVTDEKTLNAALDNALPGDTIQLGKSVTYNGDLIFNKCININTYGNDLIVNGNLIFNYVSEHTLKLNLASGGDIKVLMNGDAGGNLEINTPNSEVLITGNNYTTNLYVENNAFLSATKAPSTKGLFLSGANIVNKNGDPKDVDVRSNTRITLDYGASLTLIKAVMNATNIEIINYGTIGTIHLGDMLILDDTPDASPDDNIYTEYTQIYIDNYNTITTGIQLPTKSSPFYDYENANGFKEGNTMIIRQFGASQMTILENLSIFQTKDIIDHNIDDACVIQEVEGKDDSLIVYYGDREGEDTTVEFLLREYFEVEYGVSGLMIDDYISRVKRIIVYSLEDKKVTPVDLSYLNKMPLLQDLDLYKAQIQDNTIPASQFVDNVILKKIVLPDTLTTIKAKAFANSGLKSITIPASVTSWDYTALTGITYVFFNSVTPSTPTDLANYKKNDYLKQYLFVDEAAVDEYVSKYGNNLSDVNTPYGSVYGNNRFFVKGDITDDGQHVVRKTAQGYELVCYSGDSRDILVGYNLYLNGQEINITSVGAYCYSNVPKSFSVSFMESVTQINDRAFFCSKVKTIDFNNVRYIGDYAFYHSDNLNILDTKRVQEIGQCAFAMSTNLFSIKCPELEILRTYAFSACRYLAEVEFSKLKILESNVFYHKQWNINDYYNHMVRAYFLNESFEGVTYSAFSNTENTLFKAFVRPECVDDFRGIGCVTSNLVYPVGEEVGTYEYQRTFTIDGESVTNTLNLGEYVVYGDNDNAQFVCYNVPIIDSDFEVPGTAVIKPEGEEEYTKTITSVGKYAFNRIKIERIVFSFAESIKYVDSYLFYNHSTIANVNSYSETSYYVRVTELKFNNVENIGSSVCTGMIHLTNIDAPNLKAVNSSAFKNCLFLKKINIPNVEEIYDYAFQNCAKLFYLDLPKVRIVSGAYILNGCSSLVSVKFGPYLEKFNCTYFLHQSMNNLREIILESECLLSTWFTTSGWSYPNLKIYVPDTTIGLHHSSYTNYLRETGEKIGENWLINYDETVKFNIGMYTAKNVVIDEKEGLSICSFNWLKLETPSDFVLPNEIEDKKIIRLGYRAFYNMDFSLIDTSNSESKENFTIPDYLLEIGKLVFSNTSVRVSEFKNVQLIDDSAFYNCSNMYVVNAPELLFVGASGFNLCVNIVSFDAKKLIEIESSALARLDKCEQILTNIQKAADIGWLQTHSRTLITFATDEGALLSGVTFPAYYYGTLKLTSSAMAGTLSSNQSYMTYSIEDITLADEFYYPVKEADGTIIYNVKMYRYAINNEGDVKIVKCLNGYSETDEFLIPSRLDDRTVTTIGALAFHSRSELANKKLVFGDSIKTIEGSAFQSTGLTGILNLNNVEKVGNQAFSGVKVESIIAPKLTDISSNHVFFNNSSLVSLYLNNMENFYFSTGYLCPNLKYIYSEKSMKISNFDGRQTDFSGYTFVLNCQVTSADEVNTTGWQNFHDITIYVPYISLEHYQKAFKDTSKYVNFTILPIGVIVTETNKETGLQDQFVLVETEGEYDHTTDTYERVFELLTIITQSPNVIIPDDCEVEDGSGERLPITKLNYLFLKGQPTITSITLPKYIRSFDDNVFLVGENLKNIYVKEDCEYYASDNGVLYTKDFAELVCYPKYHDGSYYKINDDTKVIRSYAFKDCSSLINVEVGKKVEIIGVKAFEGTTLGTIVFTGEIAPVTTGVEIFDKGNIYITVYVPSALIEEFRNNSSFAYLKLVVRN